MKNFRQLLIILAIIGGLVWDSQPIMHSTAQTDSSPSPVDLLHRMKVDRWHANGYDGRDITIGVTAASFPNNLLIAGLWDTKIKFCEEPPSSLVEDTFSEQVAQMLYTLNVFAPGATIYFQPVRDPQDYSTALECFKKQNVKIAVNYSGYFQYVYRVNEIEQDISRGTAENDFLWLFPAGNYGRSFYESPTGIRPVGTTNSPQHNFGTSLDTPMMEIVASETSAQRSEVILHFVWQVPQNADTQILHDQVQLNVYRAIGASCADQGVENELLDPVFDTVPNSWDKIYPYFLNMYYMAKPGDHLCIELIAGPRSADSITSWPFTLFIDNAEIIDQYSKESASNSIVPPNNSAIGLTIGALDDDGKSIAGYSSSNAAQQKPNLYTYGTLALSESASHIQGTRFSVAIAAGIAASYWDRYDDTKKADDIRQMILEDTSEQKYLLSARNPAEGDQFAWLLYVVPVGIILLLILFVLIIYLVRDRRQVLQVLKNTKLNATCFPHEKTVVISLPLQVNKATGLLRLGRYFRVMELRINVYPRPSIPPSEDHFEIKPDDGELAHTITWGVGFAVALLTGQFGLERGQGHKAVALHFHENALSTVRIWLNYRFAERSNEETKSFAILLKKLEFETCPDRVRIEVLLNGRNLCVLNEVQIQVQSDVQQKPTATNMPRVFLSYRRDDTLPETFNLYRELTARLGDGQVFMDLFGINPGDPWEKVLEDRLSTCRVVLVIIGNQWLSITDSNGQRRLENKDDIVRKEVFLALSKVSEGLKVIPVLVEGTRFPSAAQLPKQLRELAEFDAITVGIAHFDQDIENLIKAITC